MKIKLQEWLKKNAVIPIFVLIIIIASIVSPDFFALNNLVNLLRQQSFLFIASIGSLLVIILGYIDLSIGSQISMYGVLLAVFVENKGYPVGFSVVLVLIIGLAGGLFNGLLVEKVKLNAFIATLATMSIYKGLSFTFSNGFPIYLDKKIVTFLTLIGKGSIYIFPVTVIIALIFGLIFYFILRATKYGCTLYAVGGNREASRLAGISVSNYGISGYVITGFLCSVAAILMTSRLGMAHTLSGDGYELDAIAAVIMGGAIFAGGRGSVGKMAMGVITLGLIRNVLNLLNVAAYPQLIFKGLIILLAVILGNLQQQEKMD